MWKSKLQSVELDPQNSNFALLTFLFKHTDGRKETVMDRFSNTSDYVKYARNYITKLENADSLANFVATPPLGDIVTEIVPVVQTPEEIKKQQYEQARQTLIQAKEDLDCKIIEQAEYDAKVLALKTLQNTKQK